MPTAWCGWWAVGGKEATCDRNAALPSTCPAPRSHFRVRGSVHNCGGIQPASTHARTRTHTVEFRARWSTLAPSVHGAPCGSRGQAGGGVGRPGWCPSYPGAWEGKWEPGAAQPHYWWCWVAGGGGLVIRKECERGEAEEQHE